MSDPVRGFGMRSGNPDMLPPSRQNRAITTQRAQLRNARRGLGGGAPEVRNPLGWKTVGHQARHGYLISLPTTNSLQISKD